MTPAEAYTAMQGQSGFGMGLSTYPDSPNVEERYTHLSCLALEASACAIRHTEGITYAPGADATQAQRYVIWMPIAGATPPPPPDRPDNTLPTPETPPAA